MTEIRTTKWLSNKWLKETLGVRVNVMIGISYSPDGELIRRVTADIDHEVLEQAIYDHPSRAELDHG